MVDLVTGATGFIGSHLVRGLTARSHPVRALVHCTPLLPDLIEAGVQEVNGDLNQPETLKTAMDDVDRIFHCAALVSDWGDPEAFVRTNVTGVANLLAAAKLSGVRRFIHLSTTDVYGHPNRPVDEDALLRTRGWPYGDTKIAGERLVWNEHDTDHLDVTVIRPANVYGVGSLSFVDEIATLLHHREMVHMGWTQRPAGLCHVDSLVDAIRAAADNPTSRGRAYNVTDGSTVTWRQFINDLADAIGSGRPRLVLPRPIAYLAGWCMEKIYAQQRDASRPLLTRMAVEIFTTNQAFAIDRARRELGYRPRRQFAEALPEMVRWLEGRPA